MKATVATKTTGNNYRLDGDFDCEREIKTGKVIAIEFYNQGSNSIATVEYGGAEVVLYSAPSGQGDSKSIDQPTGHYDTTRYRIKFRSQGDDTTPVNNLVISCIKEVE